MTSGVSRASTQVRACSQLEKLRPSAVGTLAKRMTVLAYDLSNYNDRHDPSDSGYSIRSKNLKANATSLGLGVSWFIPKIEKVAFFAEANISKIHSEYKFSQQEMSQDTDVGDYSKIDKSAKFKFGFNYMF